MSERLSRWLPIALAVALIGYAATSGTALAQVPEGRYKQVHAFTPAEGEQPTGRLLVLPDGRVVGTASFGGEFGLGTLYQLKPGTGTFEVLHSFAGGDDDGASPVAGLVAGPDGNLWGVTQFGGKDDAGTIYRLQPDGRVHIVHMFGKDRRGGRAPVAALTLASDGLLYGTTQEGGPNGFGTVFRLESDASVTILWGMSVGGPVTPTAPLLQASDGLLYGTSVEGGSAGLGTLFSLAPDGTGQRVLVSFTGTDGLGPRGGMIEASDGLLYGATNKGGKFNCGAVYRLARDGSGYTVIHSFTTRHQEAFNPFGELLETSPGVFLGTSTQGGHRGEGTVYQVLSSGKFTSVYEFTARRRAGYIDGSTPATTLTLAGDGSVIGVTQSGGAAGDGTIFRMRPRQGDGRHPEDGLRAEGAP